MHSWGWLDHFLQTKFNGSQSSLFQTVRNSVDGLVLPRRNMSNEADVTQFLTDYYTAFSTLDIQVILPYFHEPALLIGPLGVLARCPPPRHWSPSSGLPWKTFGPEDMVGAS